MRRKIIQKKKGAIMENMLVALLGMVMTAAFLVIIFGALTKEEFEK